jgi:hypothetical protein
MAMRPVDGVQVGLLGLRQAVAERGLGLEGIHIARDGEAPVSFRWVSDDRRSTAGKMRTSIIRAIPPRTSWPPR